MSQINQKFDTIAVLVGRDLVGDALMKLPFVRALRNAFPAARIHWISTHGKTAFAGLLRDATRDLIDSVEEQPGWLTGVAPAFDLVIDTRNRWREVVTAKKIPHRLFLGMALHYLVSDRWPSLGDIIAPPAHLSDRMLRLVEMAAGFRPPSTGRLALSEKLKASARQMLPPGQTYIGIAPGAGNPVKIWPRYKFEQVAACQVEAGRVPVFLLGPQELPWYDELVSIIPAAKFPLQDAKGWDASDMTIDHTLAVASLLDVAVANDSGVGHMLAAVNCPLISLFGPTDPAKLAPRVTYGHVVRAQDFDGSGSMNAIPVEAVTQAVSALLRQLK